MNKRFQLNIFSAASQIISQTILFIILYRYLISCIGLEQLGVWSVVMATVSAAKVCELGFGGSITKFVAAHTASGNAEAAAQCLQTAAVSVFIFFTVVASVSYPLLMVLLPTFLPQAGLSEGKEILPYGLLSLMLTSTMSIWMRGLDACLRIDMRAGLMIIGNIFFFFLSIASVPRYGLLGLALAQVFQGLFLTVFGWILLRRVMKLLPIIPLQWKFERFKEMFSYGVNFQINSLVMLLFEPTTKMLLGRFGELSLVAYFEMAQRLVGAVRSLVVESNRVIVPIYAGVSSDHDEVLNLYYQNIRYLFFFVVPVFAGLIGIMPVISDVWVGGYEPSFITMGIIISFSWIVNITTAPAYFAYLGLGKLRWVTMAYVFMGLSNVTAGLVLGSSFGWQGVVTSFSSSLIIGSFIPVWAYHFERKIRISQLIFRYDLVSWLVYVVMAIMAIASYKYLIDIKSISMWIRAAIVTSGITCILFTVSWFHPLRSAIFVSTRIRSVKS